VPAGRCAAIGSIIGTFALARKNLGRRIAGSYAALGLSALAWLLADAVGIGLALVALTGVLEGPAELGDDRGATAPGAGRSPAAR